MPAAPLKPLNGLPPLHFEVNINYYDCLGSNMKEIDDTPLPESESEDLQRVIDEEYYEVIMGHLDIIKERIDELLIRIANLETQRTPQDENDDPEWFS